MEPSSAASGSKTKGEPATRLGMIWKRGAEDYLARVEAIVRRYRLGIAEPRGGATLELDDALAALRKLGFTTGEALRLLRPGREAGRAIGAVR
jgi:hypothetical protein